jgi:hypothetical protein
MKKYIIIITNIQHVYIGGRVKFLPLAWAGMPKTSFRKNSDSPLKRAEHVI